MDDLDDLLDNLSEDEEENTKNKSFEDKVLIIGDPHFKHNKILQGKEFAECCISYENDLKKDLDFTVLLGDILDTHEIVRTQPFNLACEFIKKLAKIKPIFVLIGNHDYINNSQFLTDKHPFNTLKAYKNVYIVDKPLLYTSENGNKYLFCPYTPNGRLLEALETVGFSRIKNKLTCCFGHQEIKGCKMGACISDTGDVWDPKNPILISGHIHDQQRLAHNMWYPGVPIQHSFSDSSDKGVWLVEFNHRVLVKETQTNLGIKNKKIIYLSIKNIDDFDSSILQDFTVKLNLKGTTEEIEVFKKNKQFTKLKQMGLLFSYTPTNMVKYKDLDSAEEIENRTYNQVFKELIDESNDSIKSVYDDIFNASEVYELVFKK